MRVYLTSFATERFKAVRRELSASAITWDIPNILSFDEKDLHETEFYRNNRGILDEVCGAGYWAWKPYFILEALKHLNEGDALFYADAGSAFISSPQPLVDLAATNTTGLVLFDARPLTNRQFTKRDCFIRLDCDTPEHWNSIKVIATLIVARKCDPAIAFLNEWLRHCQDRAALTDDENCCGSDNLEGFLQHRWDQAILSVLASKHKLETYRNPTVWGNYLKLPEFRQVGEVVASPYHLVPEISTYSDTPQGNSPYGTIFEINRLPNAVGKPPLLTPVVRSEEKEETHGLVSSLQLGARRVAKSFARYRSS